MAGKVEEYLLRKIREEGAVHMTLIDPEEVNSENASSLAKEVEGCQTSAIMIGGTTSVEPAHLDEVVKAIKRNVNIPVILFPNNITGISKHADAIWFMSLLNSSDPYFIVGAQVLGAPLVKAYGLEPIPLGYVIVGEGGSVGVVGRAFPIPPNKPELAVAYALASEYLGMRFVYLEAGSGAKQTVPSEMVMMVKRTIGVKLIVGGGIRTREKASEITAAGADVLVTGTVLEKSEKDKARNKLTEIIRGMREGVKARSTCQTKN